MSVTPHEYRRSSGSQHEEQALTASGVQEPLQEMTMRSRNLVFLYKAYI
jgi:hypothetical protein